MARAETIMLASGAALALLACAVPYGAAPSEGAAEAQSPSSSSTDASPPATPPRCAARSFPEGNYHGVCVDQGADLGPARVTLVRGTCESGSLCVPCTVLGNPTRVAGCPSVP